MAELVECKTCTNKGDSNDAKTCSSCGSVLIKTWVENKIDKITPEKLAKWFLGMIVVVILLVAGVFGRYFTFFDDGFSLENTIVAPEIQTLV